MSKLIDLKTSEDLKVLVYGDSGTGKTVFSTSFPGPVYVADFDGKISSAASYWGATNKARLNEIEYDKFVPEPNTKLSHFHAFKTKLEEHSELGKQGKFPFKTYVVDSLTLFSEAMMQEVIRANPGISRVEKTVPALQDYLIFGVHFKQFLAKILALPCNVVVTAHAEHSKDDVTGSISIRPMLSGKLSNEIPIRFAEVYHSKVVEKEGKPVFILQTKSAGKEVCRTQIPGIPQFIRSAYSELVKQTKGETNANN